MKYDFTIYSAFFLATSLISFFVALLAWERRTGKGAREMARLMIATGIWAFWLIPETAALTQADKVFWSKLGYFGAVSSPVLYLLFILRFTGKDNFISVRNSLLLFIIPAFTLGLAITNEDHHLLWSGFSEISAGTNLMEYHHGIGFWLGYAAYNNIVLLFGTILLFRFVFSQSHFQRRQGIMIILGGVSPWVASIFYLLNINLVTGFDITPVSIIMSGVLLVHAILFSRFLDLAPVAREMLVETLQDGILALDDENVVQDINTAAIDLLGISNRNIIGSPVHDTGATNRELLGVAISADPPDQLEIQTDDRARTYRIIHQPITDKPGSRLILIRDITEQVERQNQLRAMDKRFREMFTMFRLMADNMPDMLWAKDLDKNFIFTNKSVCENLISAKDTGEPIGKSDLFFAERERMKRPDRSDWYTFGELCRDSDQVVIESRQQEHFDEYGNVKGQFLFLDVRKAPIIDENGVMIGVVGSARDVTNQRKTQADILRRDRLLEAIAKGTAILVENENLDEAIKGTLSEIGTAMAVNRVYIFRNDDSPDHRLPLMSQMFEWTDGTVETQIGNPDLQNLPYEEACPRWHEVLSGGKVVSGFIRDFPEPEKTMLGAQGILSLLAAPIFIEKKLWGFIGFDDCTTERAWPLTEQLILSAAANTIGAAYLRKRHQDDLLKAKEKAEESDRLKSAFLANMSHEIRTPMNAITGFAGLIIDPSSSHEERDQYAHIIQSRSDDLMRILNDILEISRIESGNLPVEIGEVNLNSLLEEIETVTLRTTERREKTHLEVTCNRPCADRSVTFQSDPFIIKQVFTNLIDNALKFTMSGHVRYGYTPPENGKIILYVTDSGIGIASESLELVFEHFRQADRQTAHLYGGTGLGLSICRGSLELIGGKISVESEPGKGTTFLVEIPHTGSALPPPPAAEAAVREVKPVSPADAGSYDFSGKTLLLVEDEETNMRLLEVILKRTGATLVQAGSGEELRALYSRAGEFSLVLLDVRLPDTNGWDLARELKALRPDLPVIMQTAYAMQSDIDNSMEARCEGHISKPINKEQLLLTLSEFLVT